MGSGTPGRSPAAPRHPRPPRWAGTLLLLHDGALSRLARAATTPGLPGDDPLAPARGSPRSGSGRAGRARAGPDRAAGAGQGALGIMIHRAM